jgi:hypothetical protein
MVNFVEFLFGFAAVGFLAALVFAIRRRGVQARRYAMVSVAVLLVAVVLELYLQWRR